MHTIILIPAANQDAANAFAGASDTFRMALYGASAMEDTLPLAYWSGITLSGAAHAAWEAQLSNWPGALMQDYDEDANPGFPPTFLAAQNLRPAQPHLP